MIQIIDDDEKEESVSVTKQENLKEPDPASDGEERRKKLEMLESAWNELQNANPYKKLSGNDEKSQKQDIVNVKVPSESSKVCDVKTVIPSAPKTCSQFELHWRTLKYSEENLYLYLKVSSQKKKKKKKK